MPVNVSGLLVLFRSTKEKADIRMPPPPTFPQILGVEKYTNIKLWQVRRDTRTTV